MNGSDAEVALVNEVSYLNETLQRIALCLENNQPDKDRCYVNRTADPEIMSALQDVTDYAARNTCLHEETYRGGVIWEICSQCGKKWADDEGGKPEDAHELPEPIQRAYDVLSKYEW